MGRNTGRNESGRSRFPDHGPRTFCFLLLLHVLGACATAPSVATAPWPDSWEDRLGQTMELEGYAVDEKLGAMLLSDSGAGLWIDGLDAWPPGYYAGGSSGVRVRVKGTLIRRDDLPVFVAVPGHPARSGIPVDTEAEIAAARIRYLLADATWAIAQPPATTGVVPAL